MGPIFWCKMGSKLYWPINSANLLALPSLPGTHRVQEFLINQGGFGQSCETVVCVCACKERRRLNNLRNIRPGSEKRKPKCDMKVKKSKSTLAFALHFFWKYPHLDFRSKCQAWCTLSGYFAPDCLSKQQIELRPRTRKMGQASFFSEPGHNLTDPYRFSGYTEHRKDL